MSEIVGLGIEELTLLHVQVFTLFDYQGQTSVYVDYVVFLCVREAYNVVKAN